MAGTDCYDFYANVENSPFWQKRNANFETAETPGSKDGLRQWERKLTPQLKHSPSVDRINDNKQPVINSGMVRLVTENLISHPFLVLRRQCQVNVFSRKYHLTPFSLIPVVIRLHQCQGLTVLWKGLGSALIVRGVTLAVEDFLSKITPWPKEINRHSTLKSLGHHILLKSVSLAVVIPFYAASVVETVQSDVASEKPGIFDVFQEGFCRLLSWSAPQTGRLLPIWIIVVPAVLCGTFHYVVSVLSTGLCRWGTLAAKKRNQRKQGAVSKELSSMEANDLDLSSRFAGCLVSDILLYPFETVLHRLHIQGTRTIIDNLDTGSSVIPILTRYDGFFDCWSTIVREEGRWGLYKGFGTLLFQYALQLAIIKGSVFTVSHLGDLFTTGRPTAVVMATPVVTPENTNAATAPATELRHQNNQQISPLQTGSPTTASSPFRRSHYPYK